MKVRFPKKILSLLAVVVMVACMVPMTAFAETVLYVEVTDIDTPVAGKKPDTTATPVNSNYSITRVYWAEYDEDWEWQRDLGANDTFKPGYIYVVFVKLKIKDGSTFGEQNRLNVYVNNQKGNNSGPKDNGTTLEIYTSYQIPKSKVSNVSINVTAPVEGDKPVFNKVSGTGYYSDNARNPVAVYTNGIAWYKNSYSYIGYGTTETFQKGKDYTVKVSLVAQDGYEFDDNISVTINGKKATVENYDESITAYVTLTATAKATSTPAKPAETPTQNTVSGPKAEEPTVETTTTEEPKVEEVVEEEPTTEETTKEETKKEKDKKEDSKTTGSVKENKKDTKSMMIIIATIAAIVLIPIAGIALTIIIIVSIIKKKKNKQDDQQE